MPTARETRAARPALDFFPHLPGQIGQMDRGHAQFGKDRGRGVDGEVVGRHQHAGGDQGHDGDEAFHQHGTVADEQDVPFVADHFRRGAGADDGVEAGQGAAGDGNEDKGEDRAGNDRAAAADKLGDGLHQEVRTHKDDTDGQHGDGADLQVGGQVIAGAEQQPDRQDRGDKAVDGNNDGTVAFWRR